MITLTLSPTNDLTKVLIQVDNEVISHVTGYEFKNEVGRISNGWIRRHSEAPGLSTEASIQLHEANIEVYYE
mgnify:CR=1 FL=1